MEHLASFLAVVEAHCLWPLDWITANIEMRLTELVELGWDDTSRAMARLGHAGSRTMLGIYSYVLPVSERDVDVGFAAFLHAGNGQIVNMTGGKGRESAIACLPHVYCG